MNEFDDLDQLERECGPALRVALRRVAAEISVDTSAWQPGPTRFLNGEHAARDEREADATSADDLPRETHPGRRWMLVAAATIVVLALGLVVAAAIQDPDSVQTDTVPPTPAPSTNPAPTSPPVDSLPATIDSAATPLLPGPFVGHWRSTDADGSSQTMDVEQWAADEYFVVVNDEAARCPGGAQITGTGRLATDTSLLFARPDAFCWDEVGSSPSQPQPAPFTLDLSTETGELVDSFGVVWREQVMPLPDAEQTALLEAFLGARLAGEGAEQYLLRDGRAGRENKPVPLLYATTGGAAYERFEIERVPEPGAQPDSTKVEARLFAEDGTVVEQRFHVVLEDGQLGLVYGRKGYDLPTTENGQSVPVPFSILSGEVTFAVAPPWIEDCCAFTASLFQKSSNNLAWFAIAARPLRVGAACETPPYPTDAEALARSIIADSGFETTEPVPVRIAGLDGLQMDVAMSEYGYLCGSDLNFQAGGRIRLYMVDYPGESAQVLTLAVLADPKNWEDAIDDIAPILDSIQFHLD